MLRPMSHKRRPLAVACILLLLLLAPTDAKPRKNKGKTTAVLPYLVQTLDKASRRFRLPLT